MTPSELKAKVSATGSHHFESKTMKFFGDTMRNYGVRSKTILIPTDGVRQIGKEVWELYRRHSVKHGLTSSAYFDKETFECVFYNPV
jgi:hypothetical protein